MDTLTHALSGALLGRATAPDPARARITTAARMAAGALAAAFPDADFFLAYVSPVAYLTGHRGLTHSIFLAPLWALLLAWLLARIAPGEGRDVARLFRHLRARRRRPHPRRPDHRVRHHDLCAGIGRARRLGHDVHHRSVVHGDHPCRSRGLRARPPLAGAGDRRARHARRLCRPAGDRTIARDRLRRQLCAPERACRRPRWPRSRARCRRSTGWWS